MAFSWAGVVLPNNLRQSTGTHAEVLVGGAGSRTGGIQGELMGM